MYAESSSLKPQYHICNVLESSSVGETLPPKSHFSFSCSKSVVSIFHVCFCLSNYLMPQHHFRSYRGSGHNEAENIDDDGGKRGKKEKIDRK